MATLSQNVNFPSLTQKDPTSGAMLSYPIGNPMLTGCSYVTRQYQAVNSVATLGGSVAMVDFVIQNQSEIHSFSDLLIEFTIANTGVTGGAAELLPTPYWLQTLQYLSNSAPLETFYPQYLYATILATYSQMQQATLLPLMASSTTDGAFSPTTLAIGTSAKYYLPLTPFLFLTQGVLIPQVRSEQRIRLNVGTANTWVTSNSPGTSVLAITNIQLFAGGLVYRPNKLGDLTSKWQQSVHLFPKGSPQLKNIQLGAVANTTVSGKVTLNATAGAYMGTLACLYEQNGFVNEDVVSPLSMDLCQLYQSDGSQYNYCNTDLTMRYVCQTMFVNSAVWANNGSQFASYNYMIPFVLNFNAALKQQSCCEGWLVSPFSSVAVTPTSTLVNGRLDLHLVQAGVWAVLPLSGITTFTFYGSQST